MARIRTIKPEFAEDEKLGEVSRDARLLFILLWTVCDDVGRFRASPVWLRTRLFPYDNAKPADVARWLGEISGIGRVTVYEVDGERYGQVVNWAKHQRVDNAGKSLYPEPPPHGQSQSASLGEPPRESADGGDLPLDLGPRTTTNDLGPRTAESAANPNPPSLAIVPDAVSPPATASPTEAVFSAWKESTGHQRARLDEKRRRIIQRALKAYPPADLVDAVRGWRHSPFHAGENDRSTVYNDLSLLLRDAEKIEYFRDLERHGPPRVNGTRPKSHAALERVAREFGGPA